MWTPSVSCAACNAAHRSVQIHVGGSRRRDLIVHVVDGSHPDPFSQIDAVNDVLSDIDGVETIPTIVAFNKADRMDEAHANVSRR